MNFERTHYEALMDVRYGRTFSEMNERFFNRIDMLFGAVQLFMGSAAAASLFGASESSLKWAGALLAIVAVLERLIGPGRKAESFAHARAAWGDLDARGGALTLEHLDPEIRTLQSTLPSGIGLLAMPACNANLRSNGHEDRVLSLTWMERLASAVV